MKRALVLSTLAGLLGACGGQPSDSLSWRESWEMLVLGQDGSVIDARLSVSNTGLLRSQGHLRAERWSEDEQPIIYARDVAPVEVAVNAERTAVRFGYDGLALGEEQTAPQTWTLRARDDEARVLLHLTPAEPSAVRAAAWQEGGGQWTLSAPVPRGQVTGWVSATEQGGLVDGWGTLLHRGGDGRPQGRRTTLLIVGRDVGLGLDTQGQGRLSWAWLDGQELSLGRPTVKLERRGPSTIRFESGVEVELRLSRKVGGERLLYEHLLGPEQRVLSWLGQWRERRVRRGWARVRHEGRELLAAAVLIEVDQADWQGPVDRPEVAQPTDRGAELPPIPP